MNNYTIILSNRTDFILPAGGKELAKQKATLYATKRGLSVLRVEIK